MQHVLYWALSICTKIVLFIGKFILIFVIVVPILSGFFQWSQTRQSTIRPWGLLEIGWFWFVQRKHGPQRPHIDVLWHSGIFGFGFWKNIYVWKLAFIFSSRSTYGNDIHARYRLVGFGRSDIWNVSRANLRFRAMTKKKFSTISSTKTSDIQGRIPLEQNWRIKVIKLNY